VGNEWASASILGQQSNDGPRRDDACSQSTAKQAHALHAACFTPVQSAVCGGLL